MHSFLHVCIMSVIDFSGLKLKEITNCFLDLIEWNEGADKIRLRIYSMTAANWKTIARKLGLEDTIPGSPTARQSSIVTMIESV